MVTGLWRPLQLGCANQQLDINSYPLVHICCVFHAVVGQDCSASLLYATIERWFQLEKVKPAPLGLNGYMLHLSPLLHLWYFLLNSLKWLVVCSGILLSLFASSSQ